MTIEVNNESGVAVDEKAIADLGRYVLDELGVNPLAELSVVLLDVEAMSSLHVQWMDLEGPTDVMAFPMDGPEGPSDHPGGPSEDTEAMLGDVVLCPEVATKQAKEAGHSFESELHLLTTHGILHLLGYDHAEPEEEREMFDVQARLVRGWAKQTGGGPIHVPIPGADGVTRDHKPRD